MSTPSFICRKAIDQFKKQHPELESIPPGVDYPPRPELGDLALALPMRGADKVGTSPRELANKLASFLEENLEEIEDVSVEGPGFVNITFRDQFFISKIEEKLEDGELDYLETSRPQDILIEFVSANPTGPLHVGHGRGAIYGDVLARLLELRGHDVQREYYVNDAGEQIRRLGESIKLRARQDEGEEVEFSEEHYRGDYLVDIVRENNLSSDQPVEELAEKGREVILERIFDHLDKCKIKFDSRVSEREITGPDEIDELVEDLREAGAVYEEEGAIFLASSRLGDDKDRVLIRADGRPTYFANDLLYHRQKFSRDFERLIDIWGHDHHGYQQRLQNGLKFLGLPAENLEIELYQLVDLYRGGEPVSMSTRGGDFVPLSELVEEVGADAVRFNFLTKNHNRPLDFDIKVATSCSEDNPVYYVQYAHTRVAGILRKAPPEITEAEPAGGLSPEGHKLLLRALEFPEVVREATESRQPHQIPHELQKLASLFHNYYTKNRVIDPDRPRRSARRLAVVSFLKLVLKSGLNILGVTAPERM